MTATGNLRIIWLVFLCQFGMLQAGDTIDLQKDSVSNHYKLPRDAEITLETLTKFRCQVLYIGDKYCIVKFTTGKSGRSSGKGPEIAQHRDTSLGRYVFMIPLQEIRMIAFWKTRKSGWAELPVGLSLFTTPLLAVAAAANGFPPGLNWAVLASTTVIPAGAIWQKRMKYLVNGSMLIRIRRARYTG